jgi:peptidoglycan/xylan/chitin deacetylase (PgdA/CDA1 family)
VTEHRLSCCLTFDFDAMSSWIAQGSSNPSEISRGEFGAVAVPRILALLREHRIRSTFCVPGHTAYAYPDLTVQIAADGHEIAHHGWVHENPGDFDRDGERRNLERGLKVLEEVAGVRPAGYRSPAWSLTPNSLELLLEAGFAYDSSCMGHDHYAYRLRRDDRWSRTEPYVFGAPTELIEVPVTWTLDDWPAFEYAPGLNRGLAATAAVEANWRDDFDFAYERCPGGVFNLTMHPQVIGRGHRFLMLERLIGHFARAGVVFESLGDYAERWRRQG